MGTPARIADLIRKTGWTQGKATDSSGAVCVSQATYNLHLPVEEHDAAGEHILAVIEELFPERIACRCNGSFFTYAIDEYPSWPGKLLEIACSG